MLHEGVSRGLVDACSRVHKVRSDLRHDSCHFGKKQLKVDFLQYLLGSCQVDKVELPHQCLPGLLVLLLDADQEHGMTARAVCIHVCRT